MQIKWHFYEKKRKIGYLGAQLNNMFFNRKDFLSLTKAKKLFYYD